jgi:hypothetical protein
MTLKIKSKYPQRYDHHLQTVFQLSLGHSYEDVTKADEALQN